MNERTDATKTRLMPEFSNRFIYLLIAAACATLLAVFSARIIWRDNFLNDILAKPEAVASRTTVEYGITEFQGGEISDRPASTKILVLSMILLSFVLAPLGLLLGWRNILSRHAQQRETNKGSKPLLPVILIVIASGILVAHLFIVNLSGAIVGPWVFETMIHDNALDQNRSYVISELEDASVKAFQYYFLPAELGGGGRSFRSHPETAKDRWITLKELGVPTATPVGSYSIKKIENDTIMVIRGTGTYRIPDGTYPEYEIRMWPSQVSPGLSGAITKIN